MPLNDAYLNALPVGGNPITHIGLVQQDGTTAIAAARQPVTWNAPGTPGAGDVRMQSDLTFAIAQGESVGFWQGYNALTGGTAYGAVAVTTPEGAYANPGEFNLAAETTGINHDAS